LKHLASLTKGISTSSGNVFITTKGNFSSNKIWQSCVYNPNNLFSCNLTLLNIEEAWL
jgi:hypothetical protein